MSSRENLSYIVPRDPSIKCWNDRIKIAEPCTKNLIQLGSEEFKDTMGNNIKVYLRLKPSTSSENPFTVLTPVMLQTEAPKESVSYKNVKNGVGKLIHKFAFTTILDQNVSQAELFKISVVKNLKSFLSGKNYLLMAYGTTSAGKTYTMQGDVGNPGVIPRALEFVFTALKGSIIPVCRYVPYQFQELLELSEDQIKKNLIQKNFILSLDLSKCQRYPGGSQTSILTSSSSGFSDSYENATFKEMQSNLTESERVEIDLESFKYSVWISMIEIYNEQVYDLLEAPNSRGERPKLIFRDDEHGHTFVKNLRYVNVYSGHEAFQILQFGRSNLHFAPTALNNKSSRSHCIFIITVAKFLDYDLSSQAIISRFSFCDLAGMERTKKALNVKDRLLESKAINTSLSILAKCLTTIKENQNSNEKKMIPYRESKLTKLFRDAIMGKEQLSIIVNVTTEPNLFDETLNVLKFSAIAQEIVTQNILAKPVVCRSRFSRIVINSSQNARTIDWEASIMNAGEQKDETSDSGVEDRQIEYLKDELEKEKKRNELIETLIREELTSKFSEMLKKQDETNELRLENESERLKKMYEEKEKRIIHYYEKLRQKKRVKLEEDLSDYEDQNDCLRELEEQSKKLRMENCALKQNLQDLMTENNKLQSKCSELKFKLVEKDRSLEALQRANEASHAGVDEHLREYRNQLDECKTKITDLKTLLNEAASDYLKLEEVNKSLRNEKEILEQDLTKYRETVADLRNENAELQKILSQRRVLIEKLEDANEEFRKKFDARQEAEEELNEEAVRSEEFSYPAENLAEGIERLNEKCGESETKVKVKILQTELNDYIGSSEVENIKLEERETRNAKLKKEHEEQAKESKKEQIQERSVKLEASSSGENSPLVNTKKKQGAEPTVEALTNHMQNLSVQQCELKSTRKKVDLLGAAIHPSSIKNTNKGKKKKEDNKTDKATESEKENLPATNKKKNKCYRKLFIENGFDDYVDLNVNPLEEMPRLRPRIAIVYTENKK